MRRWRWLRVDVVYAIHDRQVAEHGGLPGLRDENALGAALARPQNQAAYEPDAAALAACYAYAIIRNHPFADGNKRTGWVAARVFLADNGFQIHCDPVDVVRTIEAVASGIFSESELAQWFRKRVLRRPRHDKSLS